MSRPVRPAPVATPSEGDAAPFVERRHPGLAALRAAIDEARTDELRVAARAGLVTTHVLEGRIAFRARLATEVVGAPGDGVVHVPAPAVAGDVLLPTATPVPAAEGDSAVALALVHRAQAGDATAFGELYDRYVDLVYRYVQYRVAGTQLAEDLTSETFLRALRRITSFSWQGRDVGAWFVTIARNLIADHYKSSRYRLELTTDDVSTSVSRTSLLAEGPEGAVLDSLQNKVLLEAVTRLGAEQQECIVLRFLQGLSVAETARAMGKNEGSVKALQYRAVRALGRLLPDGLEL